MVQTPDTYTAALVLQFFLCSQLNLDRIYFYYYYYYYYYCAATTTTTTKLITTTTGE